MSSREWREVKLGEVCDINKNSYSAQDGWKYINYLDTGNITENKIECIQFLDTRTDKIPSRAKRKVYENDIVYSTVRPNQKHYGIIKKPLDNMLVSTGFAVISGKPGKADNHFLYYYLTQQHIVDLLHTIGEHSTSAYPSIKPSDIENLDALIPSVKEQKAIAATLSCLDDKIEINNRINKTLEEMAQAIFKSWFIDFEPFQDGEFEDSELGRIPKGWRIYTLSEVIEINPPRKINRGSVAPYLDMSNMPTQGHSPSLWIEREVGSGMKFMNGDTLIARITPCLENGKTAYVDFLADNELGWGSTEYMVLRPRKPIPTQFAYLVARNERFRSFAIAKMTGSSGRQRVPADSIASYPLILPPLESEIWTLFGILIESQFEMMRNMAEQSRTLAKIRDTLIPKLMSGLIRVPVEEVQ